MARPGETFPQNFALGILQLRNSLAQREAQLHEMKTQRLTNEAIEAEKIKTQRMGIGANAAIASAQMRSREGMQDQAVAADKQKTEALIDAREASDIKKQEQIDKDTRLQQMNRISADLGAGKSAFIPEDLPLGEDFFKALQEKGNYIDIPTEGGTIWFNKDMDPETAAKLEVYKSSNTRRAMLTMGAEQKAKAAKHEDAYWKKYNPAIANLPPAVRKSYLDDYRKNDATINEAIQGLQMQIGGMASGKGKLKSTLEARLKAILTDKTSWFPDDEGKKNFKLGRTISRMYTSGVVSPDDPGPPFVSAEGANEQTEVLSGTTRTPEAIERSEREAEELRGVSAYGWTMGDGVLELTPSGPRFRKGRGQVGKNQQRVKVKTWFDKRSKQTLGQQFFRQDGVTPIDVPGQYQPPSQTSPTTGVPGAIGTLPAPAPQSTTPSGPLTDAENNEAEHIMSVFKQFLEITKTRSLTPEEETRLEQLKERLDFFKAKHVQYRQSIKGK